MRVPLLALIPWLTVLTACDREASKPVVTQVEPTARQRLVLTSEEDDKAAQSEAVAAAKKMADDTKAEAADPAVDLAILNELPELERPKAEMLRLPVPAADVPQRWFEQARGFDDAVALRPENEAPVLVYFRTDWCPHCKVLDTKALGSPRVEQLLDGVMRVRVNPERDPASKELAGKFGVNAFPHVVLISPHDGTPRPLRFPGNYGPEAFVAALENVMHKEMSKYYDMARAQRNNGAAEDSVRLSTLGLRLRPGDPKLLHLRGLAQMDRGAYASAEADFAQLLEDEPDNLDAKASLAYVHYLAGDFKSAAWHIERVVQLDPAYRAGWAYFLRASVRYQQQKLEPALDDAKKSCRLGSQEGCDLETWMDDVRATRVAAETIRDEHKAG